MKSSATVARPSTSKTAPKKADIANAENMRNLCTERLTLVKAYTAEPENRDAIGQALEENRLAQKLIRRSPAAAARSARAALAKA